MELRLERARTTKDIDLRTQGSPDEMLGKLQQAGRLEMDDFLRYEIIPDRHHSDIEAEGMECQGYRFQAKAFLAGKIYGDPFGIDVAVGEPMHGAVETVQGSDLLNFVGIEPSEYRVYPLETHIAEKLHAYTMPRSRPNSRVKDLPDIALLGKVKPIDAVDLYQAIQATFSHRDTHNIPGILPDPPSEWAPIYKRLSEMDELPWENLEQLVIAVREFLDPVLLGNKGRWNPKAWAWERMSQG